MLSGFLQLASTPRVPYDNAATAILCEPILGHEPRPGQNQIDVRCYRTPVHVIGEEVLGQTYVIILDENENISSYNGVFASRLDSVLTPQKINGKFYLVFNNGKNVGNSFTPPYNFWSTASFRVPF